eukprot:TRINITY_DN31298_c0_g1_i1.p1 TRINITY_DN31298_c0_g1~~TRINITY_DN31298_c0_g1_i1.p1  ORF type:complete len:574 (-),score=161.36 TRINITY_DN31298_c0_g1_i1:94-1815(-)
MEALRARLDAARAVLSALAGRPEHEHMSKVQADAAIASLQGAPAADVADAAAMVLTVPFAAKHSQELMQAIASSSAPAAATKKRRSQMQNMMSATSYFTEAEWAALKAAAAAVDKQAIVVNRLLMLGGRCPTEPSLKKLSSLLLLCSGRDPHALTMSEKVSVMEGLKLELKRRVRGADPPEVYLETLPPSPAELKERHPALYQKAYSAAEPVSCQVDEAQLSLMDSSFRCRNGAASASLQLAMQPVQTQSFMGSSVMERFASGMMQQMHSMAECQQAMMRFMSGGFQHGMPSRGLQPGASQQGNVQWPMLGQMPERRQAEKASELRLHFTRTDALEEAGAAEPSTLATRRALEQGILADPLEEAGRQEESLQSLPAHASFQSKEHRSNAEAEAHNAPRVVAAKQEAPLETDTPVTPARTCGHGKKVAQLLDMLDEREFAKRRMRCKTPAVKDAEEEACVAVETPAKKVKPTAKAKLTKKRSKGGKGKALGKTAVADVAEPKTPTGALSAAKKTSHKGKLPRVDAEKTRMCIRCRPLGKPSFAMNYGPEAEYASYELAMKAAKKWLTGETKRTA